MLDDARLVAGLDGHDSLDHLSWSVRRLRSAYFIGLDMTSSLCQGRERDAHLAGCDPADDASPKTYGRRGANTRVGFRQSDARSMVIPATGTFTLHGSATGPVGNVDSNGGVQAFDAAKVLLHMPSSSPDGDRFVSANLRWNTETCS